MPDFKNPKPMIVIIDGIKKNLHYTIAAKMLKNGNAKLPDKNEENETEVKKIVKKPGRKKVK